MKVNCEGLPGPVAKCQGREAWDGEGGGGCGKDGRKFTASQQLAPLHSTTHLLNHVRSHQCMCGQLYAKLIWCTFSTLASPPPPWHRLRRVDQPGRHAKGLPTYVPRAAGSELRSVPSNYCLRPSISGDLCGESHLGRFRNSWTSQRFVRSSAPELSCEGGGLLFTS